MKKGKILDILGRQCATCPSTKNLELHHRVPLREEKRSFTEKEIPNLIVLCKNCHDAIHYYKSCKKELKFHKGMLFSLMHHHRQKHHDGTDKELSW